MEIKTSLNKTIQWVQKNKYVVLIILIGIVLMLIPTKSKKTNPNDHSTQIFTEDEDTTETKLANILSQISGVGKVKVMLTVGEGEEVIYQTNDDQSNGTDAYKCAKDTVIITNGDRQQQGLIRQRIAPKYLGAIIICHGADNPNIKLEITEAVSRLTGLKTNCISVLKMK